MAKKPDFFGVDISTNRVNLCHVTGEEANRKVETVYTNEVSVNIFDNQSDEQMGILSEELSNIYKRSEIKTKNCVTSIPEKLVFSRLLTIPQVKEDELDEAIHWGIKPLIPVPVEDVNISYLGVNSSSKDGKEVINWYVVAAPKVLIEKYMKLFKAAGLNLLAVETESLAVTRLVFNNYDLQKDVLTIDVADDKTNLVLGRNQSVVFSQSIDVGLTNMVKAISSDYGISENQALQYVIQYGLDTTTGDDKIAVSLNPVMQLFQSELTRTIAYYQDKLGGGVISNIFVTGIGSSVKGIESYLKNETKIESIVMSNFKNFKLSKEVKDFIQTSHPGRFSIATGLAIKGS